MGLHNGCYATCWSVEDKGNYTTVRLTTTRKNKDGKFEQDFSGFCTFIGNAKAKAAFLKEKDRIKIESCDVTSKYDRDSKREYINFTIFDFEKLDNSKPAETKTEPKEFDGESVEGDEELPF